MRISDWSSDVCSSDLNPLHARVDRQGERLSARRGIGQPVVEGTLDPGDAMPLRIGKAEDVGREGDLRIEPFLLSREFEPDLADRIDRGDLIGERGAANKGRVRYGQNGTAGGLGKR